MVGGLTLSIKRLVASPESDAYAVDHRGFYVSIPAFQSKTGVVVIGKRSFYSVLSQLVNKHREPTF